MAIFETDLARACATAAEKGVPLRYLYDDNLTVPAYVAEQLQKGKGLTEVFFEAITLTPDFPPSQKSAREIAMMYIQWKHPAINGQVVVDDATFVTINSYYRQLREETEEEAQETGSDPLSVPPYRDLPDLQNTFQIWMTHMREEMVRVQDQNQKYQAILLQLQPVPPLPIYTADHVEVPLENYAQLVTKLDLEFTLVRKDTGRPADPVDGLELFNLAQSSPDVPFIQYNDDLQQKFYRVHEASPDALTGIPLSEKLNAVPLTLYLKVHVGNPGDSQYELAAYSLLTGKLRIDVERERLPRVTSILSACLTTLKFTNETARKLSAVLYLDPMPISLQILNLLIHTEEIYRSCLLINEFNTAVADHESSRVSIGYRNQTTYDTSDEEAGNALLFSFTLNKDPSVPIRVNLQKVRSLPTLQRFLPIFTRLMCLYKASHWNYDHFYDAQILTRKQTQQQLEGMAASSQKSKGKKNLDVPVLPDKRANLERDAGEVVNFKDVTMKDGTKVNGYTTLCQRKKQPLVLDASEVADWQADIFQNKKGEYHRRVVAAFPPPPPFPDPNYQPLFYYTCNQSFDFDGEENSYPSLVKVPEGHFMDEEKKIPRHKVYPYIPCCAIAQSGYNSAAYYAALNPNAPSTPAKAKKSGHKNVTNKISEVGRSSHLPLQLGELLRAITEAAVQSDTVEYTRVGVPPSYNSLIHCVLSATNHRDYLGSSPQVREEWTAKVRNLLSRQSIDLYRQELYDWSDAEIQRRLADPDTALDPYYFYRGVEEYFGINLFVFLSADPKHEKEDLPILEIPRCRLMHLRAPRPDRFSVILIKVPGGRGGQAHCEIVTRTGPSGLTSLYGKEMTASLYDILQGSTHHYSWSFAFGRTDPGPIGIENRDDPFNKIDWTQVFPKGGPIEMIAQQVDTYGKLRALQISKGGVPLTLYVPPGQPLLLERMGTPVPATTALTTEVLGTPSGVVEGGLWYRLLDYPYGLYVPTSDALLPFTPAAPPAPVQLQLSGVSTAIQKLRRVRKYTSWLMQLINWLWRLQAGTVPLPSRDQVRRYPTAPLGEWWARWVHRDEAIPTTPVPPSALLRHRLPAAGSTVEGVAALRDWWSPYFQADGVHLYPALYDRAKAYFLRQEKQTEGLPTTDPMTEPPRFLEQFLVEAADFRQIPSAHVFTSTEDLESWLRSRRRSQMPELPILRRLVEISAIAREPILYMDEEREKTYLIQNVAVTSSRERALQVAYTWYTQGVNSGYDTTPIANGVPHVIYQVSTEQKLVVTADRRGEKIAGAPYLALLQHSETIFSALLPIR